MVDLEAPVKLWISVGFFPWRTNSKMNSLLVFSAMRLWRRATELFKDDEEEKLKWQLAESLIVY